MGYLKNELSNKNKYHLSKHRYLELKHFCLQYHEWQTRLRTITDIRVHDISNLPGSSLANDTEIIAIERIRLKTKIELVERTAYRTDASIGKYLLVAVTEERSYPWLQTVMGIPCSRDMYYDRYRKFFWLLSQDLQRV